MERLGGIPLLCLAAGLMSGCVSEPEHDYGAYLEHMPRSIVVLPPVNETAEVTASNAFLSTITRPLAEKGYYVFPVAVVDRFMKENGLPTPGEMHEVPPQKLGEVFGADAVLYVVIKEWTTKYIVIDTSTVVKLDFRLVDARSGVELWRQEKEVVDSSSRGQGDIFSMLAAASIYAIMSATSDMERGTAVYANNLLINDPYHGMLCGRYHPDFEKEQQLRRERLMQAKPKEGGR